MEIRTYAMPGNVDYLEHHPDSSDRSQGVDLELEEDGNQELSYCSR